MKSFLTENYGVEIGTQIFEDVNLRLAELDKLCEGKSETQRATMREAILPRAALYLELKKRMDPKLAYNAVWEYTKTAICQSARQHYLELERMPFFFFMFKSAFLKKMTTSDNWDICDIKNTGDEFGLNITRCLWHDTCVECRCPELCQVFCDSDWENFVSLHKVVFSRNTSIGTGGKVCDFLFKKGGTH